MLPEKMCYSIIPVSNGACCSLCGQNPITVGLRSQAQNLCTNIQRTPTAFFLQPGSTRYQFGDTLIDTGRVEWKALTTTAALNSRLYLTNSLQSKHDLLLRWHLLLHSSGRDTFLRYEWS